MTTSRAEVTRRMRFAWSHRPYTLVFGTVLPIPGALALIYGDAVSRALENISSGPVSRIMGGALFIGGILALVGIALSRSLIESLGLAVMAFGCFVYGAGVILGLGLAGAVAGSGFIAIGLGTVLRVMGLIAIASELRQQDTP